MQCKNPKEEKKLLNCICEVNIDGKMALVSLYDDLPHFEYDLTIDNLKNSITKLRTFIQELKQQIKKLENENTRFKTVNNVLSKNITSLYTTASNEIQRKDKIIDDLRKSQVLPPPYTSKMFSSTNNFQLEKSEVSKLSKNNENTVKFKNTVEKAKVLNTNNNDNITAIVIKPTLDIPKTIYSKRMCQKLAQQNKTLESKKQTPQHIENTNTADTITQDQNEELNNDKNILLEMSTSIHNESKDIINSTLVICESDITPSDCELDTTPVIPGDNQEKDKENVSIESLSSRLKQPAKLKKKLIISPATIGVQNMHTKTSKCAKKLNQINNLTSKTQCNINNSPEKQIIKSLNEDLLSLSTSIKNNFPKHDPKTVDKSLTTGILHNQELFTSEKNNQLQSINIEVEQFPIRRKKLVIEKDNSSLDLSNVRKRSCVNYKSLSNDSKFNKSTENVKCLSKNKDSELSSPFQQKNNKKKCNLDSTKCANNIIESKHLNNSFESSSKNTPVETSLTNKTVIPSINIEVEKVPIIRRTKVIENDNNTLNKFKKVTQESYTENHKNKYDSKTNDKQLRTDIPCDQKLPTCEKKNQNQVPSINIEVEQFPIRRRKTVIEKDNNSLALSNVRKRSRVTYSSPSIDSEFNKSTENVKCLSMNNDRVDGTHTKTFKCTKKLNQINNLTSKTQCDITNSPEKQIIKSLNEDTLFLSTSIKNNFPKHDPKTDDKPLTKGILHNQELFTSEKNNQLQSINIEVEQFPIKRKKLVIEKDNSSLDLSNVRKRSCVAYKSPSNNSEFNKSTENVKCLSKNNDRKPSSSFQQKNNQSKYNLDTIKCANNIIESKHLNNSFESSSKNTSVETSLFNKTVIPSINIEVEQGFIFRRSNARKVIMHSTSDDKQETKKGRRVQLITIKDHYSKPAPSFNGAKKTEIDVSKKSILIEKVVESSSHFYVPQVKRRRTMNFSSADS